MKKTWMLMVFLCISLMAWGQDIETIKAKAQAGDPEMQVKLGNAYFGGEGITENHTEALKWYRKAAEQEYDGDYYLSLGMIYQYEMDNKENEAIKWYKKYADYLYKSGYEFSMAEAFLKVLGIVYDPRTKETTYLNSSASDKEPQTEQPHSFSYTYNPNGLYIEATDEKNIIIMENYADNFVTANLSVIAVDESSKILSIILSESKSVGRISKLLWKGSANLAITLSNGEVFRCSSNACSIKKGYGSLTTSMSASAGFLNLRSTNSPSGNANKSYAEKQFSTYDITKIVLNDCTFVVRSDTSSDKERMMRSACTIKAMLDDLKKRIE